MGAPFTWPTRVLWLEMSEGVDRVGGLRPTLLRIRVALGTLRLWPFVRTISISLLSCSDWSTFRNFGLIYTTSSILYAISRPNKPVPMQDKHVHHPLSLYLSQNPGSYLYRDVFCTRWKNRGLWASSTLRFAYFTTTPPIQHKKQMGCCLLIWQEAVCHCVCCWFKSLFALQFVNFLKNLLRLLG